MITYPLNNIDYTAEDAELYFSTRHSGVYDGDDDFAVSVSGIDNDVTVGAGIAWIRNTKFSGKVVALKNPKTLTLDLADSVYDRIDAIVIRFDANENSSDVIVKKGTASSLPVAPSVSRTESVYELHIFHIHRRAGATTIGVNDVIDQRKNPDYCGIMIDPISSIDETLSKRGFAADAMAVGEALKNIGSLSMKLLWENAHPTSTFAEQTITLDALREYDYIEIYYRYKTDREIYYSARAPLTGSMMMIAISGYYGEVSSREVETSNLTGIIDFKDAYKGSSTKANSYIIPIAVFGIKGIEPIATINDEVSGDV